MDEGSPRHLAWHAHMSRLQDSHRLLYLSIICTCCRFVQTEAYKAFRQTGKMQFPEFGTQVSAPKSLWLTLLGATGVSQGAVVFC